MKSSIIRSLLLPALLGLVVFACGGCNTTPTPHSYDLSIEIDPALAGSSIQLDIIGANAVSDLPKFQSYPVGDYWQPGDAMRRDSEKAILQFGQGKPSKQMFLSSDPLWNRWLARGAMYIVVLVDLPGISADREGNADPRRLILPIDRREWPDDVSTLQIRVQESGIRLLTPKKSK